MIIVKKRLSRKMIQMNRPKNRIKRKEKEVIQKEINKIKDNRKIKRHPKIKISQRINIIGSRLRTHFQSSKTKENIKY